MSDRDETLADYLEGTLPSSDVEALESELKADAELKARLDALRDVLSEPVRLPEVPVPEHLEAEVLDRLDAEGLIGDGVPAGLFEATLDRLEAEGLVEPEAVPVQPEETLAPVIRFRAFARMAAAALIAAALGLLAGRESTPAPTGAEDGLRAQLARVSAQKDAAEAALGEVPALRAEIDRLQSDVRAKDEALARSQEDPSVELREQLAQVTRERDSAREAARDAREAAGRLPAVEAELASLRQRVDAERARASEAETQLARAEQAGATAAQDAAKRIADLEGALAQRPDVAPEPQVEVMHVAAAERVGVWDPAERRLLMLKAGAAIPRGAIVVSQGSRSTLTVGMRTLRLPAGLYQVNGTKSLAPIPQAGDALASLAPQRPRDSAARPAMVRDRPTARFANRRTPWSELFGALRGD